MIEIVRISKTSKATLEKYNSNVTFITGLDKRDAFDGWKGLIARIYFYVKFITGLARRGIFDGWK